MAVYVRPLEYVIFCAVLLASLGIGVFYSFVQTKSSEYLQGQRKLGVIPVGVSTAVSMISAIAVQGVSAEYFLYGVEPVFFLSEFVASFIAVFTFIPLFYPLSLTSTYEYLGKRFESRAPRTMAVILDVTARLLYLGVAVVAPAQALESMLRIPMWTSCLMLVTVCTIYTALGGIKGVVWADVFQATVMILGLILVIVVGYLKFKEDFDFHAEMKKRGRLSLNFGVSPFVRQSVLAYLCYIFFRLNHYKMQYSLMRYNAVKSVRHAQGSILIGQVLSTSFFVLSGCAGLMLYGYYAQKGCDPLSSGAVSTPNQLLPYFVVEVLNYPCVPGLFASVITASALSTISSVLNALSAVAWTEIFSLKLQNISDKHKTIVLKSTVVVTGLIVLGTAFLAQFLGGTLMQISSTIMSVTSVGSMSIFILAATFPFIGSASCVVGSALGVIFILWVTIGRILYGTTWPKPQLIDDTCQADNYSFSNMTTWTSYDSTTLISSTKMPTENERYLVNYLYSISPYMYMIIGASIGMSCSLLLTLIPAANSFSLAFIMLSQIGLRMKNRVHPSLLFPYVRRWCSNKNGCCKANNQSDPDDVKKRFNQPDDVSYKTELNQDFLVNSPLHIEHIEKSEKATLFSTKL